jgi:carboxyl-terminal processing protease
MRLTTARYYTPSGRSIQAKGIDPDIEVPQAKIEVIDEGQRRHEADLRGALANPDAPKPDAAKPDGAAPAAPAAAPTPDSSSDDPSRPTIAPGASGAPAAAPTDYQLARAVDLLRGVALFGERSVN